MLPEGRHAGWLTSIYDKALCAFPCTIQYNLKSAALSCYLLPEGGNQLTAPIALKLYTYNVYVRHRQWFRFCRSFITQWGETASVYFSANSERGQVLVVNLHGYILYKGGKKTAVLFPISEKRIYNRPTVQFIPYPQTR